MPSPTSTACCKLLGKATGVARTCCKLLEKVQSVASRACCKLLEKLASRGCCKLLEQVKSVAPSDCMVSKCKRNDRYQPPPTPHPLLPRSIQRGSSLLRQQCWSWPKIWQQSRTFESPRYQKLATKWDDPPYSTRFFFRCWFYELLHLCKYLGQPCDPAPQNIRRIIILPSGSTVGSSSFWPSTSVSPFSRRSSHVTISLFDTACPIIQATSK